MLGGILGRVYPDIRDTQGLPMEPSGVIDAEQMLALHPDAVVGWPHQVDNLKKAGLPVLLLVSAGFPASFIRFVASLRQHNAATESG